MDQEPTESPWPVRIVFVACLLLVIFEIVLVWQLFLGLKEAGVL
jgi:hypothetical protein